MTDTVNESVQGSRGNESFVPPSPPVLEIYDLTVSFDGFKALNNLNFSMREGELRVIIGPNGAGKTTLLDEITG